MSSKLMVYYNQELIIKQFKIREIVSLNFIETVYIVKSFISRFVKTWKKLQPLQARLRNPLAKIH